MAIRVVAVPIDRELILGRNIDAIAKFWSTSPVFDSATREEISRLILGNQTGELNERFYRDLEFGTGGLRGILGAGTSRMNIFNVGKASAALALYLRSSFGSDELRVAVSFDSRRFSPEFAKATASVLAAYGVKVFITKELRPVPMLSFMVRHFKCHGGVCITASHNPPVYNGFKVYWQTGGQLVPPHDAGVIQKYGEVGYEDVRSIPYEEGLKSGQIVVVGEELDTAYFSRVSGLAMLPAGRDLSIVYSPLHGAGGFPVSACLKKFGFTKVSLVPEQALPDGAFPTVKYPNPEDPEAMSMAVALARQIGADLVLATDPDVDRIGVAFRDGDTYTFLNGNQIGSLLVDYVLFGLKETGRLPKNPLVVKTIVTTDLQEKIARSYGASCEETLTGFKWICQLIDDYESGKKKPYRRYVCGGEESYGFLMDDFVRDKDAVSAACLVAEMTAYYKVKGQTLGQALDGLFRKHGVYQESLETLTLPGMEGEQVIRDIMSRLRSSPPQQMDGMRVEKIKDYYLSQELTFGEDGQTTSRPIILPQSNVLQFILEDGSKVSVRPSGTEPKIKFYFSVCENVDAQIGQNELQGVKRRSCDRVDRILKVFKSLAGLEGV